MCRNRSASSSLELRFGVVVGKDTVRERLLRLWLVLLEITREACILWRPVSLWEQCGPHFPLFLKAARAGDLQIAAAVARFFPGQIVWFEGLAVTPEDIGVLIVLGAASPIWVGQRGIPRVRLAGGLHPSGGFLAFFPAVC